MIRLLGILGVGALAMYYFDPVSGRRRRALLRDQLVHAQHRAQGVVAETRSMIEQP